MLGALSLPGKPFDGHTLAAQIAQTERITGVSVTRACVDRGHRGHDADKQRVFLSGQKRGVRPTIRREIRRRAGIEPVIGHIEQDGISAAISSPAPPATPSTSSSPPPATASASSAPGCSAPTALLPSPQLIARSDRILHG